MPRAKVDPQTGLTEKQEKFCVLYVTDKDLRGNGTDCYLEVFKPKKAKRKTINERASRFLAESKIQARIKALREQVAEKATISAAEVLEIAGHLARAKLADFYNEEGNIKPPSEWTEEMKHAAASLKTFEEYEGRGESRELVGFVRELKTWDKNSALDRLFKHFGLFEEHNKQVTDPVRELLAAIDGRSKLAPPGQ